MKSIILAFFILFAGAFELTSQEKIKFEQKFLPNKKYTNDMVTTNTSKLNFLGTEEFMDQLKKNGMTNPIEVKGIQTLATSITTGQINDKNEYEIRTVYDNMISTQFLNGVEKRRTEGPINGMTAFGWVDEVSRIRIDSLIGGTVTNELKITLTRTIEGMLENLRFPDEPLEIGETFVQELAVIVPMSTLKPIQVIVRNFNTLKKVEGKNAYFDIEQEVSLNSDFEQPDVQATGTGTGYSIFNFSNSFLTDYNVDLAMTLIVKTDQLEISSIAESSISNTTKIEDLE